jgi:hypothetical protein
LTIEVLERGTITGVHAIVTGVGVRGVAEAGFRVGWDWGLMGVASDALEWEMIQILGSLRNNSRLTLAAPRRLSMFVVSAQNDLIAA